MVVKNGEGTPENGASTLRSGGINPENILSPCKSPMKETASVHTTRASQASDFSFSLEVWNNHKPDRLQPNDDLGKRRIQAKASIMSAKLKIDRVLLTRVVAKVGLGAKLTLLGLLLIPWPWRRIGVVLQIYVPAVGHAGCPCHVSSRLCLN